MRATEGRSIQTGFDLGLDGAYHMTDFDLSYRHPTSQWGARLGGDRLRSASPRVWVGRDFESQSHTLFSTAGERPILFAPGSSKLDVKEALSGLDAAARRVNEEHRLVLRRPIQE